MKDEEQHDNVMDRDPLQNNRSVFRTAVAFIVLKTESIHIILVRLTAGSPGRQIKILCGITRLLMHFGCCSIDNERMLFFLVTCM